MENNYVARSISKLSNYLRRRLDRVTVGHMFTGAEARLLRFILLNQQSPLCQRDIEEEYAMRAASVSQLLAGMEREGLIQRQSDENDSRMKRIYASESAILYADKVTEEIDQIEADLTKGISAEDLRVFQEVVDKMLSNLA